MQITNMNALKIPVDSWPEEKAETQTDYSAASHDGQTQVFFKNLANRLIDEIRRADLVLGSVAWLTHRDILDALAAVETVMIVQKEDFLRPDIGSRNGWAKTLRKRYERLHNAIERYQFPTLKHMSVCGDPSMGPVRCVGAHNRNKTPAFPRAHHKFAVFCKYITRPDDFDMVVPYAAWSGSFNWTENASNSFENAFLTKDAVLVHAFYNEWAQVAAFSEPLDWKDDWVAPEWRIGT